MGCKLSVMDSSVEGDSDEQATESRRIDQQHLEYDMAARSCVTARSCGKGTHLSPRVGPVNVA